jgi:hypothetical protein
MDENERGSEDMNTEKEYSEDEEYSENGEGCCAPKTSINMILYYLLMQLEEQR